MRIKLYVTSTGKIINIQNVQLKYNRPDHVVVAFDCHKRHEEELWDEEVIFVNHKYKELFRGDMCRLSFLYYQADGHKPKVQFEIWDPYVKYGPVSNEYISKFLSKPKEEPEPVEEKEIPYLLTLHPQLRKVYEVMMAFKRRSRYYYHLYLMGLHILLRYIENNIFSYDLLFPSPVKSTAIAFNQIFKNESWEMTVLTPHDNLSSTLTFVGTNYSAAEHESLDWAPAQGSHFRRSPTSAPVSCFEEKLRKASLLFCFRLKKKDWQYDKSHNNNRKSAGHRPIQIAEKFSPQNSADCDISRSAQKLRNDKFAYRR